MSRPALLLATLVTTLIVVACAPGELGNECTPSEDGNPCVEGLQCIPVERREIDGAGEEQCVDGGAFCSIPCNGDADCASLGPSRICVDECGIAACFIGSNG